MNGQATDFLLKRWVVATFVVIAITACGGGGGSGGGVEYKGKSTPATVDEDNKEQLAAAAIEGSAKAIDQGNTDNLPLGAVISSYEEGDTTSGKIDTIGMANGVVRKYFGDSSFSKSYVVGVKERIEGECGGFAEANGNRDGTKGTITFRNYCEFFLGEEMVFDGVVDYEERDDLEIFRYRTFTVSYQGDVQRIENMTVQCDDFDCTIIADFSGSDGRVYRISDATVTGNASSGYNVSARVFDPDHGYVDIVSTSLVADCSGTMRFSSGTTKIIDSSGEERLSLTFTSCSEATLVFEGVSQIIAQ